MTTQNEKSKTLYVEYHINVESTSNKCSSPNSKDNVHKKVKNITNNYRNV